MTYLVHVMKRTEGTIKQRLFAIKMGHLVAGRDDPTLHIGQEFGLSSMDTNVGNWTKRKYRK